MTKINKIAGALAFLAAATLSNAASASSYTVTFDGDGLYANTVDNPVGAVNDTYNFSLSGLSDASGSATNHILSIGADVVQNISGFNFSIYNSSNALMSSTGSGIDSNFFSLGAGSYYAVVSGIASGTEGGKYSVSLSTEPQPVPVPAAVWLLGSGLIGLVGVARRKEQA